MTQEILDYLLIKSQFISLTTEELLEKMKDEKLFEIYCDIICNVIEHETFFYTSPDLIAKLEKIVGTKRFDGYHKPEVIHDINEIISVINSYKTLSEEDKKINTKTWIKQQVEIRKLPYFKIMEYNIESIYQVIANEIYYADMLINKKTDIQIYNPFYLLGTINLLISEYPLIFSDQDILSYCYSLSLVLKEKVFPKKHRLYSKMAKNILNSLDDISKTLQPENIKKYDFNIEKR